jgi:hypothetical protein
MDGDDGNRRSDEEIFDAVTEALDPSRILVAKRERDGVRPRAGWIVKKVQIRVAQAHARHLDEHLAWTRTRHLDVKELRWLAPPDDLKRRHLRHATILPVATGAKPGLTSLTARKRHD